MMWAAASEAQLSPPRCRALGAYLGPPYRHVRQSDDLDPLRSIEYAEMLSKFHMPGSGAAIAKYNHARVLQLMPGELPLHYKVWQLLYATRRQAEAEASYRMACQRAACDPGIAAYHACIVTSGWVHAGAGASGHASTPPLAARAIGLRPALLPGGGELGAVPARGSGGGSGGRSGSGGSGGSGGGGGGGSSGDAAGLAPGAVARQAARWAPQSHVVTVAQPDEHPRVAAEAGDRAFFAFNPALIAVPREWGNEGDKEPPAEPATEPAEPAAEPADTPPPPGAPSPSAQLASPPPPPSPLSPPSPPPPRLSPPLPQEWLLLYRYSDVRSVWSLTAPAAWQRVDQAAWRSALDKGTRDEMLRLRDAAARGGGGGARRRRRRRGGRQDGRRGGAGGARGARGARRAALRENFVEATRVMETAARAGVGWAAQAAAEAAVEAAAEAAEVEAEEAAVLEAEAELGAEIEMASRKAAGQTAQSRWQAMMAEAEAEAVALNSCDAIEGHGHACDDHAECTGARRPPARLLAHVPAAPSEVHG